MPSPRHEGSHAPTPVTSARRAPEMRVSLSSRRTLYLDHGFIVGWKRCRAGAGGHRPQRAAMSPVEPPATTVGEPGIFAAVTHDRTVAWLPSH
jgi:hypothetical protein